MGTDLCMCATASHSLSLRSEAERGEGGVRGSHTHYSRSSACRMTVSTPSRLLSTSLFQKRITR